MVKLKQPIRQPRTSEDVMQEVSERAPAVLPHCFMDRDWIWYCGPSLQGEEHKPVRAALLEIGFRFSPAGHLMPDGVTVGRWGHACTRPLPRIRKPEHRHARDDEPATLADLGL